MNINANKETFARLKFIGIIQIGEKIDLKNMHLQCDGLFTQVTRTINQENRSKCLIFLQDTINKTFEILESYKYSKKKSEQIICSNLMDDLKKSKLGLKNLKETYVTDRKFCCDIDTLLQMIDAKLIESNPSFEYTEKILSESTISLLPPPYKDEEEKS